MMNLKSKEYNRNFIAVILFLLFILLQGCNQSKNKNQQDPILKSYQLIDEQRTDEAISLLEGEILKSPEDVKLNITLASAYAHKAGVKLQKLVGIVLQIKKSIENRKKIKREKEKAGTTLAKSSKGFSELLIKINSFIDVFESIPNIDQKDSVYLKHAIFLLSSLGNKLPKKEYLYKAILEVILFKYTLNDTLIEEINENVLLSEQSCKIDYSLLSESMINITKLYIMILIDLSIGTDSNYDEELKIAENSLSELSLNPNVLKDQSDLILKQNLVQFGFGRVIECKE